MTNILSWFGVSLRVLLGCILFLPFCVFVISFFMFFWIIAVVVFVGKTIAGMLCEIVGDTIPECRAFLRNVRDYWRAVLRRKDGFFSIFYRIYR